MISRKVILFLGVVGFVVLLFAASWEATANADDIQWTDLGADHLWSTPENWDLGRVPTLDDEVLIDAPAAAAPNGPVIQDGIAAQAKGLLTEAPGEPMLTITGGSLEVAEWIWWGDGADSFGVWTMSGGTVTVADEFELGWDGGAGTLTMPGGTIHAGEVVIPTSTGAFGELFLHGGTYHVTKSGGLEVKENGLIDITEGTLVLEGDETAKVNDLIAADRITACGGQGDFELDYDDRNPGKTTLTAVCPEWSLAGTWFGTNSLGHAVLLTVTPLGPDNDRFAASLDIAHDPSFGGMFPGTIAATNMRGTYVKTGLNRYAFTVMSYGLGEPAEGETARPVVYISVVSGEGVLTDKDTQRADLYTAAAYAPDQDPFGDEPPAYGCFPVSGTYKRMPVVPSCELPPPEPVEE